MKVESGDSSTSTAAKKVERGESSSSKAAKKKKVERGEPSSSKAAKKKKKVAAALVAALARPNKKRSAMTIATLKVMNDWALKRVDRKSPGVIVRHFDNTDVGYDWLLPGWIAEERFVPSGRRGAGRLYKYYYDPAGRQYNTRREVLYAWEKTNIICLDA